MKISSLNEHNEWLKTNQINEYRTSNKMGNICTSSDAQCTQNQKNKCVALITNIVNERQHPPIWGPRKMSKILDHLYVVFFSLFFLSLFSFIFQNFLFYLKLPLDNEWGIFCSPLKQRSVARERDRKVNLPPAVCYHNLRHRKSKIPCPWFIFEKVRG